MKFTKRSLKEYKPFPEFTVFIYFAFNVCVPQYIFELVSSTGMKGRGNVSPFKRHGSQSMFT